MLSGEAPHVHVLGSLRVTRAGVPVDVGGRRPRSLLAALAARTGAPVLRHELVLEVWGDAPPRTAIETLHSYVSRIRRALRVDGREEVLTSERSGYALRADSAVVVDARRFEELSASGERALGAGRHTAAARDLRAATDLWHGEAYADVARGPLVEADARRLGELRALAVENRIDADLLLGQVTPLIAELEALIRAHPLRERLHAQRMLALHRLGRQAEALDAYLHARALLVRDLGIEPGPLLRRLQELMLRQHGDLTGLCTLHLDTGRRAPAVQAATRPSDAPAGGSGGPLADAPAGGSGGPLADEAVRRLRDHRLVTVTGLPGAGKSHLLAAVEASPAPWPTSLVDARTAPSPAAALASAFGLEGTHQPSPALCALIGSRPLLLCLDADTHAPASTADLVRAMLQACPGLRLLVATRNRLRLAGEHRWRLPHLALPDAGAGPASVGRSPAVALLVERIREHTPGFQVDRHNHRVVAHVAEALDGLPLALELAAEAAEVVPLDEVAHRSTTQPGLLATRTRGRPPDHRSLGAALHAVVDRLGPDELGMLASLGAFRGGFTPEAVAAVWGGAEPERAPAVLAALLDGPVLVALPSCTSLPRYARPELVGADLRARGLRTGRAATLRHATHVADLAERAAPQVVGGDQVHWLNRLHEDHANIEQALATAHDTRDGTTAARIVAACAWFWTHFGHVPSGHASSLMTADLVGDAELDPQLEPDFRLAAGMLALAAGDRDAGRRALRRALHRSRSAGDGDRRALALAALARTAALDGQPGLGLRLLGRLEATGRPTTPWVTATLIDTRGMVLLARGDPAAGLLFDRAERAFRHTGDEWSACLSRLHAAWSAARRGDAGTAARLHRANVSRAIDLTASTFDFVGLPRDLRGLAVLAERGEQSSLATLLREAAAVVDPPRAAAEPADGELRGLPPVDVLRLVLDRTTALLPPVR